MFPLKIGNDFMLPIIREFLILRHVEIVRDPFAPANEV